MKKITLLFSAIVLICFAITSCSLKETGKELGKLQIISVKRVDSISSYPYTISWDKDNQGIVVIVKRANDKETILYYSDFSIGFPVANEASCIPRSQCMGISDGLKTPNDEPRWTAGGKMGRVWQKPGELYFALLFSIPQKIKSFTLYISVPTLENVNIPPQELTKNQ